MRALNHINISRLSDTCSLIYGSFKETRWKNTLARISLLHGRERT